MSKHVLDIYQRIQSDLSYLYVLLLLSRSYSVLTTCHKIEITIILKVFILLRGCLHSEIYVTRFKHYKACDKNWTAKFLQKKTLGVGWRMQTWIPVGLNPSTNSAARLKNRHFVSFIFEKFCRHKSTNPRTNNDYMFRRVFAAILVGQSTLEIVEQQTFILDWIMTLIFGSENENTVGWDSNTGHNNNNLFHHHS